ncbi:atp synthase delta mitochondrial precursor [Fusarium albosuccineum]|uniref:ATP synthase subunit delta, mitochondrial n=1 Tax=Fusarium albosuccineum TaxID=1237068 RepID=A0A8H4PBM7_9HYPO|nr:atp synthase delta mitochondrial precursor [Fusarium albosuccineum]
MNSLRFARAALRARPAAIRVPVQRRTYAEAIKLSLALPHQAIYKSQDVVQVNIPAESGDMGVLANHVPSIEQLKPGLVEIVEESSGSKQFFLSGGFATVQPNSVLSINAVEGYPLEDFSADAIRAQIAEAQKVASGSGSEQDIAEAKIELEVLETLAAHFLGDSAPSFLRPDGTVIQCPSQPALILEKSTINADTTDRTDSIRNRRRPHPPAKEHYSGFGKPASRNTLIGEETPSLPLEQTHFDIKPQRVSQGRSPARNSKDDQHASGSDSRKLRSSVSAADLGTGQSRRQREESTKQRSRSSRHAATEEFFPQEQPPAINALTSSFPCTRDSATVCSTERRQDAMDIFEEYRISRPSGWLSGDDLGTTRATTEARPRVFQICHSCGAPLSSQRYCSHCGHDSCLKCTGDASNEGSEKKHDHSSGRLGEHPTAKQSSKQATQTEREPEQDHVHTREVTVRTTHAHQAPRQSSGQETPRTPHWIERTTRRRLRTNRNSTKSAQKKTIAAPTTISNSVKKNPFFMADREAKTLASEPRATARTVRAKAPVRPSDCVPHRQAPSSSSISIGEEKCSDPGCRATHIGHHPVRHSIECAARRSLKQRIAEDEELEVVDMDEGQQAQQPTDPPSHAGLSKKIDQLYHHAEDLHHSQHIMEHLAAGVRNLERSVSAEPRQADNKDVRSEIGGTGLNAPDRSRDHSLSQDEITSIGDDEHALNTDAMVPIAIKPHILTTDPTVEPELSPKSHELLKDARVKVAIKAHSISQDRGLGANRRRIRPMRQSFPLLTSKPSIKSSLQNKLPQLSFGIPKKASTTTKPQALVPASSVQEHCSATSAVHQNVHRPHDKISSKRAVQKAPHLGECAERETTEVTDISSWRKQLRKVDKSDDQPRTKQLTPPILKWRRSLSRIRRTPQPDVEKKDNCLFCYPSQSPSPKPAESTPQLVVEDQSTERLGQEQTPAMESLTPRLRLLDVEQSLARKSDEDLVEESRSRIRQQPLTTQEVKSTKHCKTTSHSSFEETETVTEIHNPRPLIPYNHVCAWRTRYMDLSTEIKQLKSEASQVAEGQGAQGVDVGVGTSFSHKCPDISIEGLTIVMHMRGKDDLVINTDLKEELGRG